MSIISPIGDYMKKIEHHELIKRTQTRNLLLITTEEEYNNSYNNRITVINDNGYKFVTDTQTIGKLKCDCIVHPANSYSLDNIKIWIKLNDNPYDIIDGQTYIGSKQKLKWRCNICKNIFFSPWSAIQQGQGCGVCHGYQIIEGHNDLATVRPDLVKYFCDNINYKNITANSHKKTIFKCPDCGHKKKMNPNRLFHGGFSCPKCSDGISIPNKFVFGVLEQIVTILRPEHKIDKFRYDFFLPDQMITIEAHGEQHYKQSGRNGRNIYEEQQNDINKRGLSESLGNIHIEIDCRKSDYEFLKEQCINSLGGYFDMSNIDWIKVYEYCNNSLVKKACELWNEGKKVTDISEFMNINRNSVTKYLKIGNSLKMTNYDSISEMKRTFFKSKKVSKFLNDVLIKTYDNIKEASKENDISVTSIRSCCTGITQKTKNGYVWKYQ